MSFLDLYCQLLDEIVPANTSTKLCKHTNNFLFLRFPHSPSWPWSCSAVLIILPLPPNADITVCTTVHGSNSCGLSIKTVKVRFSCLQHTDSPHKPHSFGLFPTYKPILRVLISINIKPKWEDWWVPWFSSRDGFLTSSISTWGGEELCKLLGLILNSLRRNFLGRVSSRF